MTSAACDVHCPGATHGPSYGTLPPQIDAFGMMLKVRDLPDQTIENLI